MARSGPGFWRRICESRIPTKAAVPSRRLHSAISSLVAQPSRTASSMTALALRVPDFSNSPSTPGSKSAASSASTIFTRALSASLDGGRLRRAK
jgi:hypothetical protein